MIDIEQKEKLINLLYELKAISLIDQNINRSLNNPPFQIRLQTLNSYPKTLKFLASLFGDQLKNLQFDLIAGPYSDIPLATTISLEFNLPMIFIRKERKEYGKERLVEGNYKPGQGVALIDDEITDVASTLQLLGRLEGSALKVVGLFVLLDRGLGALEMIKDKGYKCSAIVSLNDIFLHLTQKGQLSDQQLNQLRLHLEERRKEFLLKYSVQKRAL